MIRLRRGLPIGLLGLACFGCGHSASPVAPFDSTAAVPTPRNLQVHSDPIGRLVLRWSATPQDRAVVDGWFVERRVTTSSAFTRLEVEARMDTTYFDDDIAEGVRYVYRVLAVTGAGVTSLPIEAGPVRGDRTAPATPGAVVAVTASGGIQLSFVDAGEPDLAFFEVRLTQPQSSDPPEFRQVSGSPALIGGLAVGSPYAFEIAAVDSAGRISAFSEPPVGAIAGP